MQLARCTFRGDAIKDWLGFAMKIFARHQRRRASCARPDYAEINFRDIRRDGRFRSCGGDRDQQLEKINVAAIRRWPLEIVGLIGDSPRRRSSISDR